MTDKTITILGTGMVAKTIAKKLANSGFSVFLGSRNPQYPDLQNWAKENNISQVLSTLDAITNSEIIMNCLKGEVVVEFFNQLPTSSLKNKIIIDISNPIRFTNGQVLLIDDLINTTSIAEEIQKAHPEAEVVKTLNTVNCELMVNPKALQDGNHTMYVAGNQEDAKSKTKNLLKELGWLESNIIDLGDIKASRGLEMMVIHWVNIWKATGTLNFNVNLVVN